MDERLEFFSIFGPVYIRRLRAYYLNAGFFQRHSQIQRRLPTKLDDNTVRLLSIHDVENVLPCKRLKVQPVGSIVICAHGFWIAVHHDGLIAVFLQSERRMDAAVIELDPLSDPVRAAAQHHDFRPV